MGLNANSFCFSSIETFLLTTLVVGVTSWSGLVGTLRCICWGFSRQLTTTRSGVWDKPVSSARLIPSTNLANSRSLYSSSKGLAKSIGSSLSERYLLSEGSADLLNSSASAKCTEDVDDFFALAGCTKIEGDSLASTRSTEGVGEAACDCQRQLFWFWQQLAWRTKMIQNLHGMPDMVDRFSRSRSCLLLLIVFEKAQWVWKDCILNRFELMTW